MADNTTLNVGTAGDVIGSDDISSVKYQRVKLIHGADGTNDGDVSKANPYPMRRVPISDSATSWSVATTGAAVASKIFKASAGTLRSVHGVNNKTTAQYIMVLNSATLSADGATPIDVLFAEAGANFFFDYGEDGLYCSAGITICNSSTLATKTIGSADCIINGRYL
jgi:hypothetical protein